MTPSRLVRRRLLDPREAPQAIADPIADAVNIPFSELAGRVHELPPRDQEFGVVGPGPLVREVLRWLETAGRRAVAAEVRAPHSRERAAGIGRLWEPNAFLCEILPRLPVGRVLELACGTGRDAVFLSSCGWDVTVVEVLPDALERARDLARRYLPTAPPIHWLRADLEAEELPLGGRFDLITMFRFLHRPLFARLRDWLRPGGSVLFETFTTVHRERHGKPSRAGHALAPGELQTLLSQYEIRHYSEAWRGGTHTARAWAVIPEKAQ